MEGKGPGKGQVHMRARDSTEASTANRETVLAAQRKVLSTAPAIVGKCQVTLGFTAKLRPPHRPLPTPCYALSHVRQAREGTEHSL
jgi:hypothetical protein